jgi:hypothetical protein
MIRSIIIILFVIAIFSCNNNSTVKPNLARTPNKLIINQDSILFLDFWFGMTKEDYNSVEEILISNSKLHKSNNSTEYVFKLTSTFNSIDSCKAIFSNTFDLKEKLTSIILDIETGCDCCSDQLEDGSVIPNAIHGESNKKGCIYNGYLDAILALYIDKYGKTKKENWIEYDSTGFFDKPSAIGDEYKWINDKKLIKLQIMKNGYFLYSSSNSSTKAKKLGENIRIVRITYTFKDFQYELDKKQREMYLRKKHRQNIDIETTKKDI